MDHRHGRMPPLAPSVPVKKPMNVPEVALPERVQRPVAASRPATIEGMRTFEELRSGGVGLVSRIIWGITWSLLPLGACGGNPVEATPVSESSTTSGTDDPRTESDADSGGIARCEASADCNGAEVCVAPFTDGLGPFTCVDRCVDVGDDSRWCADDAACCAAGATCDAFGRCLTSEEDDTTTGIDSSGSQGDSTSDEDSTSGTTTSGGSSSSGSTSDASTSGSSGSEDSGSSSTSGDPSTTGGTGSSGTGSGSSDSGTTSGGYV